MEGDAEEGDGPHRLPSPGKFPPRTATTTFSRPSCRRSRTSLRLCLLPGYRRTVTMMTTTFLHRWSAKSGDPRVPPSGTTTKLRRRRRFLPTRTTFLRASRWSSRRISGENPRRPRDLLPTTTTTTTTTTRLPDLPASRTAVDVDADADAGCLARSETSPGRSPLCSWHRSLPPRWPASSFWRSWAGPGPSGDARNWSGGAREASDNPAAITPKRLRSESDWCAFSGLFSPGFAEARAEAEAEADPPRASRTAAGGFFGETGTLLDGRRWCWGYQELLPRIRLGSCTPRGDR
mmetsp:Transcript_32890/g.77652  ORF Transcript_32890/g.77652 Transcript_32890/m.77652 type:complete len:292 (-) Transcript_32890:513-1388(-)